ncbi:MAG: DNA polymerase II large subunit [Candidatus Thermoplasmatota archaeon]|nr:DNA polymerase II large subunit [Candidatus Thermoplasmatota archaeon]
MICGRETEKYFYRLILEAEECYQIAAKARAKGLDPELAPEIQFAEDLAGRVEKLVGPEGISERIRALAKELDREELAIEIAKEVAKREAVNLEGNLEQALRTGLAIVTEAVPVAALEGIASVRIKKNINGSPFLAVYFAGPIRSAGGTAQALSVLIADVIRREAGLSKYIPTREEIERYKEEISLYKQEQHLQYTPSNEEIELVVKNCPVCIHGEATEELEVVGNRNLPRVETNRIRGGACLVIAEGLCAKVSKLQKYVKLLNIDSWEFADKLAASKTNDKKTEEDIGYMKDLIAGRPVLASPSGKGGFRLRYGRARNTGLACVGINPATMVLLDDFLAIGTQLKLERPGKAGIVAPCSALEGPIVLLKDKSLVQINRVEDAIKLKGQVVNIIDTGELLVAQGEFAENNYPLLPSSYVMEWWLQELAKALRSQTIPSHYLDPSPTLAIELSERYKIPLCPKYNLFWEDLNCNEILELRKVIEKSEYVNNALIIAKDSELKDILITLCAPHKEEENRIIIDSDYSYVLLRCLGLKVENGKIISENKADVAANSIELISKLARFTIRAKAPTRIGARIGRPEKSKERKMRPPVHVLFPLGLGGGRRRLVKQASTEEGDNRREGVEVGLRVCKSCGRRLFRFKCSYCNERTIATPLVKRLCLNFKEILEEACRNLNEDKDKIPDIKGVLGLTSIHKTPEALEKGILRAKHNVFVFKDGTIRYDLTNAPLTHFKPSEINISLERVKELGYEKDYLGNELVSEEQLIELKPQDIVVSKACLDYLLKVANFVDELLAKFYKLTAFYNAKHSEQLIGHLVIGLSPHTSAGLLGRIIGYTNANVCYAHPFFYAATRRNCDGDENSVILLMDALLNFSRSYLPSSRGGLMDAPLVLTTRVEPKEIDKEAWNLDTVEKYPLEFYSSSLGSELPKNISHFIDNVGKRVGTELQYEKFRFTHCTDNIASGTLQSSYKTLKTMEDKLRAQLALATKIRAVDVSEMVSKIITTHFLPDLIGNLSQFSKQSVRCSKCNTIHRRMPLTGKCSKCEGNLTLTVHEGSVRKYLMLTKELASKYNVSSYIKQRIMLVEHSIDSVFQNAKLRPGRLEDFM